jgi:hypothetical protein
VSTTAQSALAILAFAIRSHLAPHASFSVMRPHCFNQMTDPRPNGFILHDFGQIAMLAHLRLQATVLRQIGRREIRC